MSDRLSKIDAQIKSIENQISKLSTEKRSLEQERAELLKVLLDQRFRELDD